MVIRFTLAVFATVFITICAAIASGQAAFSGQVVDVIDGKTVVVSAASGLITVELQYIDVPGPGQELFTTVKEHLAKLLIGKMVMYRPRTILRDRTIGRLMLADTDVSQQLLRDGAAWQVPQNVSAQNKTEFDLYASFEAAARSEKRGVWSIPALKPAWQVRADQIETARKNDSDSSSGPAKRKPGQWGDKNPSMADIGALVNGYNAQSKLGFIGTSLIGITDMGSEPSADERMGIDLTYYYSETDKGRKGYYVFTVASLHPTERFLKNNNLFVVGEGRTADLGKPTRTVTRYGGNFNEVLKYRISRNMVDRITNGQGVTLRINDRIIYPINFRYLLYNLLQVSQ